MTEITLKIDAKAFKSECKRIRSDWEDDMATESFAERRLTYRCELKGKRHLWTAPVVDRSYEGHLANLTCAASQMLQFGATDAQCRLLAHLWAEAGERVETMNRLTNGEASTLIDYAKRRAA